MLQEKQLKLGVLNIKIHPHTPLMYIDLLNDIFINKHEVQLRGTEWGIPSNFTEFKEFDKLDGMFGNFYRFLQIDDNQPWIDLIKGMPIQDEKGNPIPQVDSFKKPNTKDVWFIFFPKKHRIIFDMKNISHRMIQAFFKQQFAQERIVNKYGPVDVIIEASDEAIEKILSIPIMTSLNISISKPNPDDLDGYESRLKDKLDRIHAAKFTEEYKARKGETLLPDKDLQMLMRVARGNGSVYAEGYDYNNKKIVESTQPHPLVIVDSYDQKNTTFLHGLFQAAIRALNQVKITSE